MITVTLVMTRPQARQWVRWLLAHEAINLAQARVMLRGLAPGDTLVYSDWTEGRVEVRVEG